MIYYGYVTIPHATYDQWRSATLNNGYDFDQTYGCQCYDLAAEFWWNVGFPAGYPIITSSSAYTMWNNRIANASYGGTAYFDLIDNITQVKRGDIMVFNYTSFNIYGHVGFADIDYSNWTPDPTQPHEFPILSQNNGGGPVPAGGATVNIHGYDIRLFLGAFRYKEWETTPPTPTPTVRKSSKFPFVLYANKLRS